LGTSIIVATDGGYKMFSQSDIDKRGIKIMREGQPAQISDFRENDRLTATIITSKPPRVMTEKEVNATLARSPAGGAGTAATPSSTPQTAAAPPSPGPRPRALPRGSCPRPPAPCRLLGSRASRRWLRGWSSPSGGVARRARRALFAAGPRPFPGWRDPRLFRADLPVVKPLLEPQGE
jgi:hypothetical protein